MMIKKKMFTILMSVAALVLFAACQNETQNQPDSENKKPIPTELTATRTPETETSQQTHENGATTQPGIAAGEYIGMEAAKAIVEDRGDFDAANARLTESDFDMDDGVASYELEYRSGNDEFEYDIDAVTGEVLKAEKNDQTLLVQENVTERKTEDEIKNIALTHAGAKANDVTQMRVKLDTDDGVEHYDVEFRVGATEYEYEISAGTGEILSYELD